MKTILVVDDNKANLTLAKQALEEDYHVMLVISGEQALRFLEKKHPDLILLDINMPELDGKDTLRLIQKNPACADIPVIFLTANTDPETEVDCLELGATDFITKPFVPQVMRVRIARTLELQEYRHAAEQKAKRFENIASTDMLTGLWNRAYISNVIDKALEAGHHVAYLMIDVDHFKSVNDTFGHIMGDTVLKQLAAQLRKAFADYVVARVGGDEFVVIIENPPSREALTEMIENVQKAINAEFAVTTSGIASTSIGVALAPRDGMDYQALYDCADKALYFVKNAGRNGYRFYEKHVGIDTVDSDVSQSILTDIRLIHRQIAEQGEISGAYWQEYEPFLAIYHFMMREISRTKGYFTLLLITIRGTDSHSPQPDMRKQAMEKLYDIIQASIRKDDVFTAYSSSQYLVLLPNTTAEAAEAAVVSRISAQLEANTDIPIKVEYSISFLCDDKRNEKH